MQQQEVKRVDYDRALTGPNAYDKFNTISKNCQVRYLNLIKAESIVLVLIGLLSSYPVEHGDLEKVLRYLVVGMSVLTVAMILWQENKNYMKGWQNARFIAESVLTNGWLFSFKIGAYNNTEKLATLAFVDMVDKIERQVDLNEFLSIYSSDLPHVADWMQQLFNETDEVKKKEFYLKYRINDQVHWYTSKAQYNRKHSSMWFNVSLIVLMVGVICSLFIQLNHFALLGFMATVTATILAWRQTKRSDELRVTYAVAAKELLSLKTKIELEDDPADIIRLVEEAEKSISREHKLWLNTANVS